MDLNSQCFDVVCTIGASSEIGQVKLNLIPTIIESHRHSTDEWLDTSRALVVAGAESAAHVLVVEYLHLECEVLLQILDNHDQKGQFNAESFLWIGRTGDVSGGHIGADDLEYERLNVVVGDTLDVSIAHLLVPYLERLGADTVQNGQKSALKCIFEHFLFS